MDAVNTLKHMLMGNFYSRYSAGDSWGLGFEGFWLVCQDLRAKEERELNSYLMENFGPANEAIDRGDIAKSVVVSSCSRKTITDVNLDADSSLLIAFENGMELMFPTDIDNVDWYWAICSHDGDPYRGYEIACFSAGEIETG